MAVPMKLNDTEEYSLRSIAILGFNMHSQITVRNLTLPKAVLSIVKIFAMYMKCSYIGAVSHNTFEKPSIFLYSSS